ASVAAESSTTRTRVRERAAGVDGLIKGGSALASIGKMHTSRRDSVRISLSTGAFLDTFRQRMLPRADMLATENSPRKLLVILAVATLTAIAGCTPSGSQALTRGDKLLRE